MIKKTGVGTKILSNLEYGSRLDILGPLGRPFRIYTETKKAFLVAGGIGLAPFYFLSRELLKRNTEVTLYWGIKNSEQIYLQGSNRAITAEFERIGTKVNIACESGAKGFYKGLVTELFYNDLSRNSSSHKDTQIFSCGPYPMLKKIEEISEEFSLDHQVLLEEKMACGVGACQSCSFAGISKKDKRREIKRVCVDGPVFNGEEIDWDAI
ncbi:MAG: dihydroorotate dehydrogenase electron transfer subunit [Thermodesulfobacteriota bacterium]|nr:dihydroorotate dehydrogenase electron transfer subunit [Thermodesulfobacteriota bacterium]